MRWLLFVIPLLAWSQTPTGSVGGMIVDPSGASVANSEVRLHSIISGETLSVTKSEANGDFRLKSLIPGPHIISAMAAGFRENLQAVSVPSGGIGAERIELSITSCENPTVNCDYFFTECLLQVCVWPSPPALDVMTVCEALEHTDDHDFVPVVIVGINSTADETLRQDCPNQLATGEIAFPNAIALTNATDPPDSLRQEIEKQRQLILKTNPTANVVALYGRLVSPAGLTLIPCCTTKLQINAAPARLLGLDERDFRVLR